MGVVSEGDYATGRGLQWWRKSDKEGSIGDERAKEGRDGAGERKEGTEVCKCFPVSELKGKESLKSIEILLDGKYVF